MKIAISSDLHVDHNQPPIIWPDADVLVIAGDTANTIGDVLKLARKVSKRFQHVVMVDGNHEGYSNAPQGRTVEQTIEAIRSQLPENVHILGHHEPRIDIDGVHFVGCNGWYSFDAMGDPIENRYNWRHVMNDNKWIGFDKIEQMMPWDRAVADARLMKDTLDAIHAEGKDQPIVCVTHTAPHRDMITWKQDLNWDTANSFYMNSHMQKVLESEAGQRVTYWVHGHTHMRREKLLGRVYCVCNPRGYPRENPTWEPVVLPIVK